MRMREIRARVRRMIDSCDLAARQFVRTVLLRSILLLFGLIAISIPGDAIDVHAQVVSENSRPNIVVIMVDDLDTELLEVLLFFQLMPNLSQHIIERGIRFDESFVTNSLCCPSRASFLTGQYSHNNGVLMNTPPNGSVSALRDSSTVATALHNVGYRTGYVGKYLNGYGAWGSVVGAEEPSGPFDSRYVPPGWDDWQALVDPTTYEVYNYKLSDNGVEVEYGDLESDYQTDVLAQRSVDFITESNFYERGDAPLFLVVNPMAPHVEVCFRPECVIGWAGTIRPAPRHESHPIRSLSFLPGYKLSFNETDVADKILWVQDMPKLTAQNISDVTRKYQDRLTSMLAVDDLIGRVVNALRQTGRLDTTWLIFTSDNGYLHGEHRLPEKTYAYEEAIRVPLIIAPPRLGQKYSSGRIALNIDLAPTLSAIGGADMAHRVDGRSLVPLMQAPRRTDWRRRFLVEHWKTPSSNDIPTYSAVRTDLELGLVRNHVWIEYETDGFETEHYDLNSDPRQLDSIPANAPDQKNQQEFLSGILNLLRQCSGDTCRLLEDF